MKRARALCATVLRRATEVHRAGEGDVRSAGADIIFGPDHGPKIVVDTVHRDRR